MYFIITFSALCANFTFAFSTIFYYKNVIFKRHLHDDGILGDIPEWMFDWVFFFVLFVCLVLCSYQLEALDKAIRENTIVFLETGSGKTLIAIMLLRSYAHYLRKSSPSPYIAVFLVPKVVLVTQVCTTLSLLFVPLQILDTLFDFYLMIWWLRKCVISILLLFVSFSFFSPLLLFTWEF